MTDELKPCPFCGGEAEILRIGDRRQSTQYNCTMCGCFLETGEEWDHGAAWNRRAIPLPDRAAQLAAALALPEVAAMWEAITALIERYDEVVTTPDCSCSQEDDAVMNARSTLAALEARHD